MKRAVLICMALIALLTACGSKQLSIKDSWARPGTVGSNSAIYMTIDNPTDQDDILLTATTNIAETAELHMSKLSEATGMMMMQPQENIPVTKGTTVALQPGGLHVMLIDLNQDLIAGETINLILSFQNAGDITLDVPIRNP